jgi:hypothetical protein
MAASILKVGVKAWSDLREGRANVSEIVYAYKLELQRLRSAIVIAFQHLVVMLTSIA